MTNCILIELSFNLDTLSSAHVKYSQHITDSVIQKSAEISSLIVTNDMELSSAFFDSRCLKILDKVAPSKIRKDSIVKSSPWITKSICSFFGFALRLSTCGKTTKCPIYNRKRECQGSI